MVWFRSPYWQGQAEDQGPSGIPPAFAGERPLQSEFRLPNPPQAKALGRKVKERGDQAQGSYTRRAHRTLDQRSTPEDPRYERTRTR